MKPAFLTYAKFYNEEDATALIAILEKHELPYIIEHEKELLDPVYIGSTLDPLVALKVRAHDFATINNLAQREASIDMHSVNPEYYLFQFTNEELNDVINKPAEWNYFDIGLAKQILAERQVEIVPVEPVFTAPVFEPIQLQTSLLVIEYIAAVFFNFVGIIIGVSTLLASKTLHDGRRVKMFDSSSRQHAIILLAIGIGRFVYFIWQSFF